LAGTAWSSSLDQQLSRERELITELWDSAGYQEGVAAFLEKRPPRYIGA
jgi:enoyl-CoA hydratase/carnithine racemase